MAAPACDSVKMSLLELADPSARMPQAYASALQVHSSATSPWLSYKSILVICLSLQVCIYIFIPPPHMYSVVAHIVFHCTARVVFCFCTCITYHMYPSAFHSCVCFSLCLSLRHTPICCFCVAISKRILKSVTWIFSFLQTNFILFKYFSLCYQFLRGAISMFRYSFPSGVMK